MTMSTIRWNDAALAGAVHASGVDILHRLTPEIAADARRGAPIDTGALEASIGHDVDEEALVGTIYAGAPYAAYVELGTSRQSPQSFLRVALYRKRS
jgi:HK97 gp10 family phage protein